MLIAGPYLENKQLKHLFTKECRRGEGRAVTLIHCSNSESRSPGFVKIKLSGVFYKLWKNPNTEKGEGYL